MYVDDFLVNYNFDTGPGSQTFKGSYLELTLILAMEKKMSWMILSDQIKSNIFTTGMFSWEVRTSIQGLQT